MVAASPLPAAIPIDTPPWIPTRDTVTASEQVAADPLRPTARDGWSPDRIVAVHSANQGGFFGSALQFALGGVSEAPGQRLSQAQVDALAPTYAAQFGLDETHVRSELAKVYLYVGGPSTGGAAMTVGHHVYMPDDASLQKILQPSGKRWLAHELAHTMQFVAYDDASPHRFLAEYVTSLLVGHDPSAPGTGGGPRTWGAFFTGLRGAGKTDDDLDDSSRTARDVVTASVLPAAALALPLAGASAGLLAASRMTTQRVILGTGPATALAAGAVAMPLLAGSATGAVQGIFGDSHAGMVGGLVGAGVGAFTLHAAGAFRLPPATVVEAGAGELQRLMGRGGALGLAGGVVALGGVLGTLSASATTNTIRGGAASASLLKELRAREQHPATQELSFQEAMHDSHWVELDAEAVARRFTSGAELESLPTRSDTPPSRLRDRFKWGVELPLIVGIPAAVGAGGGVLAARTARTMLRSIRDSEPAERTIANALRMLGDRRLGVRNSLAVGAAVTLAPLAASAILAPFASDVVDSPASGRIAGGAIGTATAGALLPLLLRRRGGTLPAIGGATAAGMLAAAGVGLIGGGVASDAMHERERTYVVPRPSRDLRAPGG